ncbi:hypothetical protein JQX13_29205 [Archangium violaceum]|uniref:hypothetical protein n=1 Tax=Archangium violaceum TaxID=83451 RepID=UPI00193B0211|nr:hypothetical protein [Archangium violaceum]QRK04338.1 hypothetical protein JQX13_29205 [Archangium violaceum]
MSPIMRPVERGTTFRPKKPEPKPSRPAADLARRDPPKAEARKPEARKPEAKNDTLDGMADINEQVGRWGNTVKLPADVAMMFNARDVRGARKSFGPLEFGGSDPKMQTVTARNTPATRGMAGGAGVLGAAQLPFAVASAAKDWRDVVRGKGDVSTAIASTTSAASVAMNGAKGFGDLRALRAEAFNVRTAARAAIDERAARAGFGPAAARLRSQAARLADDMTKQAIAPWNRPTGTDLGSKTRDLLSRVRKPQGRGDIRTMERLAERNLGSNAPDSRKLAKSVAKDVQNTTQAVLKGRGPAGLAMRTGGRFVPGLNAGIAAADVATAGATLFSDASGLKKTTAAITAAGSVLAATNIPGLSQGGAVISTLSSLAGSDMGEKALEKVGSGLKSGAKKVGGWLNPFD